MLIHHSHSFHSSPSSVAPAHQHTSSTTAISLVASKQDIQDEKSSGFQNQQPLSSNSSSSTKIPNVGYAQTLKPQQQMKQKQSYLGCSSSINSNSNSSSSFNHNNNCYIMEQDNLLSISRQIQQQRQQQSASSQSQLQQQPKNPSITAQRLQPQQQQQQLIITKPQSTNTPLQFSMMQNTNNSNSNNNKLNKKTPTSGGAIGGVIIPKSSALINTSDTKNIPGSFSKKLEKQFQLKGNSLQLEESAMQKMLVFRQEEDDNNNNNNNIIKSNTNQELSAQQQKYPPMILSPSQKQQQQQQYLINQHSPLLLSDNPDSDQTLKTNTTLPISFNHKSHNNSTNTIIDNKIQQHPLQDKSKEPTTISQSRLLSAMLATNPVITRFPDPSLPQGDSQLSISSSVNFDSSIQQVPSSSKLKHKHSYDKINLTNGISQHHSKLVKHSININTSSSTKHSNQQSQQPTLFSFPQGNLNSLGSAAGSNPRDFLTNYYSQMPTNMTFSTPQQVPSQRQQLQQSFQQYLKQQQELGSKQQINQTQQVNHQQVQQKQSQQVQELYQNEKNLNTKTTKHQGKASLQLQQQSYYKNNNNQIQQQQQLEENKQLQQQQQQLYQQSASSSSSSLTTQTKKPHQQQQHSQFQLNLQFTKYPMSSQALSTNSTMLAQTAERTTASSNETISKQLNLTKPSSASTSTCHIIDKEQQHTSQTGFTHDNNTNQNPTSTQNHPSNTANTIIGITGVPTQMLMQNNTSNLKHQVFLVSMKNSSGVSPLHKMQTRSYSQLAATASSVPSNKPQQSCSAKPVYQQDLKYFADFK